MNRIQRRLLLFVLILVGALGFIYFYLFDPASAKVPFVQCPVKRYVGLDCITCGGQRALHDLLHFKPIEALQHNAFLVLGIPLWLFLAYRIVCQYVLGVRPSHSFLESTRFAYVLLALGLLFMILRNLV